MSITKDTLEERIQELCGPSTSTSTNPASLKSSISGTQKARLSSPGSNNFGTLVVDRMGTTAGVSSAHISTRHPRNKRSCSPNCSSSQCPVTLMPPRSPVEHPVWSKPYLLARCTICQASLGYFDPNKTAPSWLCCVECLPTEIKNARLRPKSYTELPTYPG